MEPLRYKEENMKLKELIKYLNSLPQSYSEKEITFYDYKSNICYATPNKVTVVDENDEKYIDFVFNI